MTDDGSAVPFLVGSTRQQPLRQLNRIAKRPPVDIEFQDLTYSIPDSNSRGGEYPFRNHYVGLEWLRIKPLKDKSV